MTGLAEWLLAQYDDEDPDDWHDRNCSTAAPPPGPFPCDCGVPAFRAVELAAKRRIVTLCVEADFCQECAVAPHVLWALAQPYADREGFDPSWEPFDSADYAQGSNVAP